jgi:hypothetical protein
MNDFLPGDIPGMRRPFEKPWIETPRWIDLLGSLESARWVMTTLIHLPGCHLVIPTEIPAYVELDRWGEKEDPLVCATCLYGYRYGTEALARDLRPQKRWRHR